MSFAVALFFDSKSERYIQSIRQKLADAGLNKQLSGDGLRSHISLAIFDKMDIPNAQKRLKQYAKTRKTFSVKLSSLGIFPSNSGTLFLAPIPNRTLLDFHRKIYRLFPVNKFFAWDIYQKEHWMPHVTLTTDISQEQLYQALDIALTSEYPIQTTISEIGLAEIFPVKQICSFHLNEKK